MSRKFPPMYRLVLEVLRLPVSIITRRHWEGSEFLPKDGGFIVAANHISEFDAMTFLHFMANGGVSVRMLAKEQLFKVPILGWIMRSVGHVPVSRGTSQATESLAAAIEAIKNGDCVGIYPEGTLTRDRDLWPMKAKTGVGRLALLTQAPVIPVAQWGAQKVLGRYHRIPNLLQRHDVYVTAGAPVELSDLYDQAADHAAQVEATRRIMEAITSQLEHIRGIKAPVEIYDPKIHGEISKKELAALDKFLAKDCRIKDKA